jgi:hypothetical protein
MQMQPNAVGFRPDEIITSESTRSARLKWVIVIDRTLPPGRAANAAACVASVVGAQAPGIHGPDVKDGDGERHLGLPWVGCSILGALPEQVAGIRDRAVTAEACSSRTCRRWPNRPGSMTSTPTRWAPPTGSA